MKTCNICSQEKPETEFDVRNKAKGTRRAYCKVCRKAKRKDQLTRYYQNNKDQHRERTKKFAERNRQYIQDIKRKGCCVDCGEDRWQVLDFDHRDPSLKSYDIKYLTHHGISLDKVQVEIDKCDLRCANCHRYRHAIENGWGD